MQELNLYAKIEQYLEFNEEVEALHNTFKEIVQELNPKSLIDIGCGQGNFLKIIQSNSLDTFGIDLSSQQINIALTKDLNVKCINLCKINEKFDCATAIFDVINYIPKKNIRDFFRCANSVLNKNGYFIFDINTLYGFEEVAQGTLNINLDDKFIAIDAIYENQTLKTNITLFNQENKLYTKENETIKQFYHTKKFLTKELELCSFEVESVLEFKLHDGEEFDKQIFIAKKTK